MNSSSTSRPHSPGHRLTLWGIGGARIPLRRDGAGCGPGIRLRAWPDELWQNWPEHETTDVVGQLGGLHRGVTRRPMPVTLKLRIIGSDNLDVQRRRDELIKALGTGAQAVRLSACSRISGYWWLGVYPTGTASTQWLGDVDQPSTTECLIDIMLLAPLPLWQRFPSATIITGGKPPADPFEDLSGGEYASASPAHLEANTLSAAASYNLPVRGSEPVWPTLVGQVWGDNGARLYVESAGLSAPIPATGQLRTVITNPARREAFSWLPPQAAYRAPSPFMPAPITPIESPSTPGYGRIPLTLRPEGKITAFVLMVSMIPQAARPW